ncbi:hypothetical protein [Clostridium perfringens]|uniref:hypothetical protein n=1 Tax=Clostridium perfringens TaxID=1502 RepID=UPI00163BC6DE|nr:hypothetical protein [Clostridium perfringens]
MQIIAWILFILSILNELLSLFLILASNNGKERIKYFFNLLSGSLELVFMVNYLFLM